MIESGDLSTLQFSTDWDLPLIDRLKDVALIYYDGGWFGGGWEELEAFAAEILDIFGDDHTSAVELRRRYNRAVVERQKYALGEELLEYHADSGMYVIVYAADESRGDAAWFLCFAADVAALGIHGYIQA